MARKVNTLILTGWGWLDYAAAAALAVKRFPDAELRGVSTRRLPELLETLAKGASAGYSRVVILGVGLSRNVPLLTAALKSLKQKRVDVEWVSALQPPADILPPDFDRYIKLLVVDGADGVKEATEAIYGAPDDAGLRRRLSDVVNAAPRSGEPWRTLLEASMFAYRNYQDELAYPRAIRRLALGESEERWTSEEKSLVDHYRLCGHRELVGKSPLAQTLLAKINTVAKHDRARVLILGESGTGKETVALQIHNKSSRRGEPFIPFNCASVTPDLLESRFLGYEKGAFTGAAECRAGLFEQAHGGTLFLDEIGELPLVAQGVLLRVLEGGRFSRIGDRGEVQVDVRVIAATHRDLAARVRDGAFREDLFFRLCVIPIRVPSLRERPEDITDIANAYWLRLHQRRLASGQTAALQAYAWPGNVRELYNLLERASVTGEDDFGRLLSEHAAFVMPLAAPSAVCPDNLEAATREHVQRVYDRCGGNLSHAAAALGVSRNTARKYLADANRPVST
jgi:DNA-binding NtrC family response regulator